MSRHVTSYHVTSRHIAAWWAAAACVTACPPSFRRVGDNNSTSIAFAPFAILCGHRFRPSRRCHSALAALHGLVERYRKAGKQLRMKDVPERNQCLQSRA